MKKGSTVFLQVVIVLIGIGALALLFWEPRLEGRNAHASLFQIYFKDPFLAYAYVDPLHSSSHSIRLSGFWGT